MASVNKVILLGNAGRDCEIRFFPDGKAVANVSLATSTRRKDKGSGELIEETSWHRVVMYDRLAEIAGEFVKKGRPLYVEGRIKYGKYTDKDGVEKSTCDIVATELQLLGGKEDAPARAPAPAQQRPAAAPAPARQSSGFDDMDDDIPF